ncbi:hypothetical protein DRQ25_05205 [Candidatus Fermentibacteria bacterium]|nr:MAG: hypothetical protein DRQ25_05205 [Candidatus Fermentibacteria bacterium]
MSSDKDAKKNVIVLKYVLRDPCCLKLESAIADGAVQLLSTEIGKTRPCISTRKPPSGGWHPWAFCPYCGHNIEYDDE